HRGLVSSVSQAFVVNVFKTPVMKYIPFKFFGTQRANMGDRLAMQFDVPGNLMYFIDYDYRKNGIMNILTSDKTFMDAITALKSSDKKKKSFAYDITKRSAYLSLFLKMFK